ncbi:MAG: DUF6089 family protein [Flavobacteriales bacterium]|nr:DUF6089 family protein [Flavobacteriales bacterium]
MARAYAFILLAVVLMTNRPDAQGQGNWDVGFSAGIANYMGDIGDGVDSRRDFIWDLQEFRSRPALGIYARRKLDRDGLWHIRADFSRIHISGSDKDTQYAPRRGRNLHFRNQMMEGAIRLERDLMQKPLVWARQRRAMLTVRGFVGIARVSHNPEARVDRNNIMYNQLVESGITSDGQWHSLPELMTGGVDYSDQLNITTIPFGLSAIVTGQKKGGATDFYVGIEIGFRITDTDYLDDISGFYADPSEMSALGAALSSQANEVDLNAAGPGAGSLTAHSYIGNEIPVIRGNAVNDDAYGTLVITYGKVLNGRSQSFNRSRSTYGNKKGGGLFRKSTRMKF